MSKKSMARSNALPVSIDYLIENSIKFHLYITTLKPVEKGSNRQQGIHQGSNQKAIAVIFLVRFYNV